MSRSFVRYILLLVVALSFAACNITRYIPEDQLLIKRVKIEPDEATPRHERITDENDDLKRYIRQTKNKRFLGINFFIWRYERAKMHPRLTKDGEIREVGEEPRYIDMELTDRSVQNLATYMRLQGYFSSSVTVDIDTLPRRRVIVTYNLHQGQPTRIRHIDYEFRDSSLRSIILADTQHRLINPGDVLAITELDAERKRIVDSLNNRGYYDFNITNILYKVDTIGHKDKADVCMVIERKHVTDERGVDIPVDHSIYRINNVNVYPLGSDDKRALYDTVSYGGLNIISTTDSPFMLRDIVLRRATLVQPNSLYSASENQKTFDKYLQLGVFRNVKMDFKPVAALTHNVTYVGSDGTKQEEFVDVSEKYLDLNISCTPSDKHSVKADVEASLTSKFFGLGATVGYSNNNLFHGAEAFDVAARVGWEFMYPKYNSKPSIEINLTSGITFPRFVLPRYRYKEHILQPRTRLELAFDYQDRSYYRRNISTLRWGYSWRRGKYNSFAINPIDIDWIDVKSVDDKFLADINNQYLRTSFKSQLNAGLTASYLYNDQKTNDVVYAGRIFSFNLETSGNVLHGIQTLFTRADAAKDYYKVFGIRYSQYVRAEINWSQTYSLGNKMAIAYRLFGGVGPTYGNSNGISIPFDKMFFVGGPNSMRGWAPRTLGPGGSPEVGDTLYPAQVGDMRLEANVEFRFPVWLRLNSAVFFDLGNVWYLRNYEGVDPAAVFHAKNFVKQLGFNTGVGLRLDVDYVIIRVDLGIQLYNPGRPSGERWINDFKFRNMALSVGVGYPF